MRLFADRVIPTLQRDHAFTIAPGSTAPDAAAPAAPTTTGVFAPA
jgi:hypothetical protein